MPLAACVPSMACSTLQQHRADDGIMTGASLEPVTFSLPCRYATEEERIHAEADPQATAERKYLYCLRNSTLTIPHSCASGVRRRHERIAV